MHTSLSTALPQLVFERAKTMYHNVSDYCPLPTYAYRPTQALTRLPVQHTADVTTRL